MSSEYRLCEKTDITGLYKLIKHDLENIDKKIDKFEEYINLLNEQITLSREDRARIEEKLIAVQSELNTVKEIQIKELKDRIKKLEIEIDELSDDNMQRFKSYVGWIIAIATIIIGLIAKFS